MISNSSKSDFFFQKLLTDVESFGSGSTGLDQLFDITKVYLYKNFPREEADSKNKEIIIFQRRNSMYSAAKRRKDISFKEYEQEINSVFNDFLDFVYSLKPEGFESNNLIQNNHIDITWNYEKNLVAELIFESGFGLLDQIFEDFKVYCRAKKLIKEDIYFFDGTQKIKIEEWRLSVLEDDDRKDVIYEPMEWTDALIILKKDLLNEISAECFVIKEQMNEKVTLRVIGEDLFANSKLLREVLEWFRRVPYPSTMKEPFYLKIKHSSLDAVNFHETTRFE